MGLALILGGAATLPADLAAAAELLGGLDQATIFATNHAGRDTLGPIHHWVTMHVELLPGWIEARSAAGLPPAGAYWGPQRFPNPVHNMPVGRVPNWGGSSGLLAGTVALSLGHRHLLFCGTPLDMQAAHYDDPKPWRDAGNYRKGWIEHRADLAEARSFGGWTGDLLGRPDQAWLKGARDAGIGTRCGDGGDGHGGRANRAGTRL